MHKLMKNFSKSATKGFSLVLTGFLFMVGTMLSISSFAQENGVTNAEQKEWSANYPIGTKMIEGKSLDQTGRLITLSELSGERGYLLIMNRSVVW
jgi:hypothetical protein|tara:strand:+ start:606 stop:890 length:285 start_codon:yes stop_codon:yes gene_type:complete